MCVVSTLWLLLHILIGMSSSCFPYRVLFLFCSPPPPPHLPLHHDMQAYASNFQVGLQEPADEKSSLFFFFFFRLLQ